MFKFVQPVARWMPAFAGMTLLFVLSACTSLPSIGYYPVPLENNELHREVFAESYRRLTVYYLEPVALDKLVPQGFAALKEIDPAFAPQINSTLLAGDDWRGWSDATYQQIKASVVLSKAEPEAVYETFFAGMLKPLDQYSHYVPPLDAKTMSEYRDGYGGIGATFERKGAGFFILDVFINSPAAKAGLKAADSVVAIDGMPTSQFDTKVFIEKVRGPIGSTVALTLADGRTIQITRANVIPTTVSMKMDQGIATIRITRFMPGTARDFEAVLKQVTDSKARGMILDLHHNPGGLLDSAIDIAGLLLPKGTLSSTAGRHPQSATTYDNHGRDMLNGLPIYVVVDRYSASAAEVLAAALQDSGRATLIGSATYGKGMVQNVGPLPNGAEFSVTWARLLSPAGRSWNETGLQPGICMLAASPCPKSDSIDSAALAEAFRRLSTPPQTAH